MTKLLAGYEQVSIEAYAYAQSLRADCDLNL